MSGVAIQLAADSVAAASLYALVAMAVSVAHAGSGVVHLALGEIGVAGGLVAAVLWGDGLPLVPAVLAGLAVAALLSAAAERLLVAPVPARPLLAAVLLLAAGIVLREALQGAFSKPAYAFAAVTSTFSVLGGTVHAEDVLVAVAVAVIAAGSVAVLRSGAGAALRVTAAAPEVAERIGVDTARVRAAAFATAGALAAGAALLGAARFPLAAGGGAVLALRGMAAAAAGAMRSPLRIAGAALVIGAVQVVGVYALGAGGEALADLAAVALVLAGWRR